MSPTLCVRQLSGSPTLRVEGAEVLGVLQYRDSRLFCDDMPSEWADRYTHRAEAATAPSGTAHTAPWLHANVDIDGRSVPRWAIAALVVVRAAFILVAPLF